MNYREKMREYLTEPGVNGSAIGYGKWGALNPEQRKMIRRLLDEMDSADKYAKNLYLENERLKEDINYIKKELKTFENYGNMGVAMQISYLKEYLERSVGENE